MKIKTLDSMEILSERFELVDSSAQGQDPLILLDGAPICLAELVSIANKLSSALNDRGISFKFAGRFH